MTWLLMGCVHPGFEGWTGFGCTPLENQRKMCRPAARKQRRAAWAKRVLAFQRRRPEHPPRGSRSAAEACPPRRVKRLAIALALHRSSPPRHVCRSGFSCSQLPGSGIAKFLTRWVASSTNLSPVKTYLPCQSSGFPPSCIVKNREATTSRATPAPCRDATMACREGIGNP